MATKKGTGRGAPKTKARVRSAVQDMQRRVPTVTIARSRNAVTISYDRPEDALPHILDLASDFADKHFDSAAFTLAEDDVLGTAELLAGDSGCTVIATWRY
jgi:hypothetical protein